MTNEEKLRVLVRKMLREELEEMTTTGDVAGYNIPMAFQGNNPKNKARKRGIATQLGMELTPRGEKDLDQPADKLAENYYTYRNDTSRQPHQKIGQAISEVSYQLKLVERALRINSRLQKECGVTNDKLWKRTAHQMLKLEGRLVSLAARLREMRG